MIKWSLVSIVSLCLLFLFVLFGRGNSEQQKGSEEAFIASLAPTAQRLQRIYHILPSISLAQACLESQFGQSELARTYHNLYGVKGDQWGQSVNLKTQEYENGVWKTIDARFRVYPSNRASMRDHAKLLAKGTNYNASQYIKVIQATNYREAALALQEAGYATDPTYAQKLIQLIEEYQLYQYD